MTSHAEYHPFHVHLTMKQVAKIIEGHRVRITKEELAQEGGHQLHLTKVQINRIMRHRALGKGVDLVLSHLQLLHSAKHGSGMFGDLVRKAGSFLKDKGLDAATSLGSYGIDKLSDVIGGVIGGVMPSSVRKYTDMGLKLGSDFSKDQLGHVLNGLRSSKDGSGLFNPGYGSSRGSLSHGIVIHL